MDSSESSLVSGDLTSTMENVLTTNEQDKNSDKNESTYVGDSVPSSSSDANVHATVLKAVLDDPISSTSDTINSVSEMNLKNACDVSLEISVESEGGASNASELVTDTDFFSSELNMGSISTEKISEDVEDIANDLENLLGESSHEYSISSNTDRSFDLDSFESQNNKNIFEGATQTKDITTTDTSENVQLIEISQPEDQERLDNDKLESSSSDKSQVEESQFTGGVTETNEVSRDCTVFESVVEPSAGIDDTTSECINQISELESVSASMSENVECSNEFSESDVRCTEFVIQEEVIDTKSDFKDTVAEEDQKSDFKDMVAEEDQSDDEEVYDMILQIRDDNQDSTTGDEAKTEEDSQESLPQCEWSEKTQCSEEAGSSNVDLTNIYNEIGEGDDQTCTYQNQQASEKVSTLSKDQNESGDDEELKVKEQLIKVEIIAQSCVDKQPDKLAIDTSVSVEENISAEQEENNENRESDLTEFKLEDQKTEESDNEKGNELAVEHETVSADDTPEKLMKNDQDSTELFSNVTGNAILGTEQMEDARNTIVEEITADQITSKSVADAKELSKVKEEQLSEVKEEQLSEVKEEQLSEVKEEQLSEVKEEEQQLPENITESESTDEQITLKSVTEEKKISEITTEQHQNEENIIQSENVTVLNHSKIVPDLSVKLNEDLIILETSNTEMTEETSNIEVTEEPSNIEVTEETSNMEVTEETSNIEETSYIEETEQSTDSGDFHDETKVINESEQFNTKEPDCHPKKRSDENEDNTCTGNIEQVIKDDVKQEETIAIIKSDVKEEEIVPPDAEDTPTADLRDDIKYDIRSISENLEISSEDNTSQYDAKMPTENLNVIDDTTQHSEEQIVSNEVQFITKIESPDPKQLTGLNDSQINNSGEDDTNTDTILTSDSQMVVPVGNDPLHVETVISEGIKDEMKFDVESVTENQKEKSIDSVTEDEVQSKTEETPVEELMKENLNEGTLDVMQDMSKGVECLTDTENCSTSALELTENEEPSYESNTIELVNDQENQLIVASEREQVRENQLIVASEREQVQENQLIVASEREQLQKNQLIVASEREQGYGAENAGAEDGDGKQVIEVKQNLELINTSFQSHDNTELEKVSTEETNEPSETETNADFKLSDPADDSNLILNQNTDILQTSSVTEVNDDETISLELKVLQSLEESVEAICAISKEETANKETTDSFEESENAECVKFRTLDDIGILEVSSTISATNELQKEEPECLPIDDQHFNSTQFVAEVQSVEDCIQLQIDNESTQEREVPSGNEQIDVAIIDTQDSILTDELLQKEIEHLEEQNVVFPILEENFGDTIESHTYVENVQDSDLTKLCEVDDQFEVNEACKYITTNDINADEMQETEEIMTETMDLQLVDDEKENIEEKEEEYEHIISTEDISPTVEEVTQEDTDNESILPHVIIEEVDDQTVNTNDGNVNTENLESVRIEEIPDNEVITEIESKSKSSTEPLIVLPEEQPVAEVSSSLIIEKVEPESKSEELYRESLHTVNTDEHKKQDSEYSSKMSSDQNLKMTITKHRIDDTSKHDSGSTLKSVTESEHSILKIFNSSELVDDKEKDTVPRLIIKPIEKPSAVISIEEVEQSVPKITIKPIVERSSSSEAQLSPKTTKTSNRPESPKVTRSQKCDMLSPLKLTIKPVLKPDEIQQQKSSPKLTIKPIPKVDESTPDSSTQSPKITIKPIIKPCEEEAAHSPKITIKPIVKPPEQECELLQSPRTTRKPAVKHSEQVYSPRKSPEREHSPRITIKPIVKPADDQKILKQESRNSPESSHNPRITIKPLIKPEEPKTGKQETSRKAEQETTSADTSHSPRITIKPIVKPVDEQKQSKQESSTGSPKITIKPVVKPQEIEEDPVELIDFEEQIKQERIVLKINKNTKSTRKRQAADTTEKLAKIKVKYSRERGRAQIVSGQGKLKRALEGSLDSDFKRTKFEAGDLTITPINPIVQIEKIEDVNEPPPKETVDTTVVGIDDPLEKIPVFEITPESAAVMKTPLVAVQPLPPAPRKRGRPRKIPLVVREDFKDAVVKEEKVVEPPPTPPAEETGRPKRSCRGPSVRTTLGIRTRRPRGSSRGRGRGRGSRGGGTRGGRQQRISAAKLKLLKEEAASAIAEETKRLDTEQKDVEIKEEVPENVDAGTNSELVIIEEETRMSADINNSRAQTPAKQILTPAPGDVEDTQSSVQSSATTESVKVRKGTRLEVHQEPEGEVISADQLAEYYWGGGGPFMLQEQVAQFLGIKSFKRKYPGITRRPVDMQERDFIRESGLASEAMCDLGLTAVSSADILDIMYSDFQHKYEEYCKHQRDRQAKDFSNKQKALSLAASQEKTKQDIMQQAVQSAASWNASFNKARKDDRKSCMDLQTFTVHYPKGKMKKIDQPKVGFYPVALVPGQYTDYYKTFTPTELNNLPLNTMLYEPININDEDSHSDGSGSESDSSSSSSGSSSSDSSGDDNCNVCSPASSTNKKPISTTN